VPSFRPNTHRKRHALKLANSANRIPTFIAKLARRTNAIMNLIMMMRISMIGIWEMDGNESIAGKK
jgi:hypothetical protein